MVKTAALSTVGITKMLHY